MALGDADLPVYFREFGDPIAFEGQSRYANGQPIQGFVEESAADAAFDHVKVSDVRYRLQIPWNAFSPFPGEKGVIQVVAGRFAGQYSVVSVDPPADPEADGAVSNLTLRKQP